MSECNHDCSSCENKCENEIKLAEPTKDTNIKKIIAILSGKGGVGKSMVTSLLAVELAKKGYKVGIMDADITGPSIPNIFGLHDELYGDNEGINPGISKLGIKIVSINMMLENEEEAVLWRGPILGGIIKQFYSEVHWGDLDYLLVDMPPGTSDVAISLFQLVPIDGIVMVTTPSKLVSMIVSKAINMASTVNKKIYGLVNNMAYIKCDECGKEINIYGNDDSKEVADKYGLELCARLPIDPLLAIKADEGDIEDYNSHFFDSLIDKMK